MQVSKFEKIILARGINFDMLDPYNVTFSIDGILSEDRNSLKFFFIIVTSQTGAMHGLKRELLQT